MLIINADDWGASKAITARILHCLQNDVIDSVSAMVFMANSEEAAQLTLENGIDTGLHLNFTEPFSAKNVPAELRSSQLKIISYLRSCKLSQLIYNPLLRKDFAYVFSSQYNEFTRLFARKPARIDGHNHMHLCANMLVGNYIPHRTFVRRNNCFFKGEKCTLNRVYRSIIDQIIIRRYSCTNYFFHINQIIYKNNESQKIFVNKLRELSRSCVLELLAHPNQRTNFEFITSNKFIHLTSRIQRGNFAQLQINANSKMRNI